MSTATFSAHKEAMTIEISEIASWLQDILGQRLTAFAARVRDPKAIGKYGRSEQTPNDPTMKNLRELYRIVRLLNEYETPATIRAWLIGLNPELGERAPIEVFHEQEHQAVLRAAEAFVAGG